MNSLPLRMLPAIPIFVASTMLFLTIVAPIAAFVLLARWGYSVFAKAETPGAES